MRTRTFLFCSLSLLWTACQGNLEKVERRDANGRTERFQQDRKTRLKQGLYQQYREDGSLAEQATYVRDTLHGEHLFYYPDGKQLESSTQYDMGVHHGLYRQFYPDGQVHLEQQYVRGVLDGPSIRYYPNGQIEERVTMRNNEENGPFEEYYTNGRKKAEGTYIFANDTPLEQGELREYDSTGVMVRVADCVGGVCKTRVQHKE